YNCNPTVTAPHQGAILRGLAREDLFTVVCEQVMTDTARYADILLPAVTFLEQQEIRRAYGSHVVGGVQPVIPPPGEATPHEGTVGLSGRAMGWRPEPFSWDTAPFMRKVAAALTLDRRAADLSTLTAGKIQDYDFPGPTPVQLRTVSPRTADGKIHLTP